MMFLKRLFCASILIVLLCNVFPIRSANIMPQSERFSYDKILKFLKERISTTPTILIICGTGLGDLADTLTNRITIPYKDIPDFPISTAPTHKGNLVFGRLSGRYVMCMQGRFHYYEGYTLRETTLPVRIAYLLGVQYVIVTNAAGGINPNYNVGDIMLFKDHINFLGFAGVHPDRGPNDERFGPRFFPMNNAYNKTIRQKAIGVARRSGLKAHEGVYAMLGGPSYETIAEVKALSILGADAVGLSTVPEVLEARHSNMTVFGFSFISNMAVVSYDDVRVPNEEEINEAADKQKENLQRFVTKLVAIIY